MKTIEERVGDGAVFLDATIPGWPARVNVDSLALGSCLRCVLGQLVGFENGLNLLDRFTNWEGTAPAFGFDLWPGEVTADRYDALTAEWRRVILARRAEAAQPDESKELATV